MAEGLNFPVGGASGLTLSQVLAGLYPAPSVQTAQSGSKVLGFALGAVQTSYDLTMSGALSLTIDPTNAAPGDVMLITLRGAYAWSFTGVPNYPNGLVSIPQSTATAFDKVQVFVEADGSLSILPVALGQTKPTITVQSVSPLYANGTATVSGVYVGTTPANFDYSFDGAAYTTLSAGAATISSGSFSFTASLPASVAAHTLQVRQTGSGLTSPPFSLTTIQANPPTGVVATAGAGNAAVSLIMAAVAQGSPITSFQIGRGTAAGGPFTNVGSVTPASSPTTGATSAAYNDTSAVNGTPYYYQVTAVSSAGNTVGAAIGPYTPASNGNLPTHYVAADASHNLYSNGPPSASYTSNDYLDLAVLSSPTTIANANALAANWNSAPSQSNAEVFYAFNANGIPKASVVNRAGTFTEYTASTGLVALGVTIPASGIWTRIQVNQSAATVTPTPPTSLGAGPVASIPAATAVHSVSLDGKNWVQLGSTLTGGTGGTGNGSGGIAVPTNTSYLTVGTFNSSNTFIGKMFKAVAADLNGRIMWNPDATAQATGTTSFADTAATPITWGAQSGGVL